MSAFDIKTRHDSAIVELARLNLTASEIGDRLGVDRRFVRWRAIRLDIHGVLLLTAQQKREARRARRLAIANPTQGWRGSRVVEALPAMRSDRTVSEVIRVLKQHRTTGVPACIDPDHIVACLHLRGLTLDDIHDSVGIPPVEAVAAIRRAHQGHHL